MFGKSLLAHAFLHALCTKQNRGEFSRYSPAVASMSDLAGEGWGSVIRPSVAYTCHLHLPCSRTGRDVFNNHYVSSLEHAITLLESLPSQVKA